MKVWEKSVFQSAASDVPEGSVEEPVGAGAGAAEGAWYDGFDESLRSNPSVTKFSSPEELAKGYAHAVQSIGADKIIRPRADDPADKARFYNELGRPESADGYVLPSGVSLPEAGWDNQSAMRMVEKFHEAGATQEMFDIIMPAYIQETTSAMQAAAQHHQSVGEDTQKQMESEYGLKLEENLNLGNRAVEELFGEKADAITQLPLATGGTLGQNMDFIRALVKFGGSLVEENMSGGTAPGIHGMTPEQAEREITMLKADKEFNADFGDRAAPGHDLAVERWNQLHRYKNPVQGS